MEYVVNDTQGPGSPSPPTPGSGPTAFEPPLVQPFLNQAQNIALSLHHKEIQPAHLLLAISLIPSGGEVLRAHNREVETVRKCCWRELERAPVDPSDRIELPISHELDALIARAAILAEGKNAQLQHIMQAMTQLGALEKFVSLLNFRPQLDDIYGRILSVENHLKTTDPQILSGLGLMSRQAHDVDGKIDDLKREVGTGVREVNLHAALDALKRYTTTLKYIVIISALALAAIMAYLTR
jgi:ATP-dependent Clp protease ATP-binding subunit ClpA